MEKKVSYAAATWFPKLQKSHGYRLLSAIQAQCLLLISRAYKKTSTAALCVLTGTLPLHLKLEKITIQGCILRLEKPLQNYNPKDYQQKHIPTDIPPYIEYFRWSEDQVSTIEPQVKIYTDGSKMEEGVAFAFCVYYEDNEIYKSQSKLRSYNSVFQAEQLAILEAIKWSEKSDYNYIQINSDSLSSLQAIDDIDTHDPLTAEIIHNLQRTDKIIQFKWVKSHIGIVGNERADHLAKDALTSISSKHEKMASSTCLSSKMDVEESFNTKMAEVMG